MNGQNTNTTTLTKTGAIILVLSILFATLCIIFGVVILVENSESSGGKSPVDTAQHAAYIGGTRSVSAGYGKYVELLVAPTSSGTYDINLNDAYILSITRQSSGAIVDYNNDYSSYYDYSYSAYFSSGITYVVKVYTTASTFSYYITR